MFRTAVPHAATLLLLTTAFTQASDSEPLAEIVVLGHPEFLSTTFTPKREGSSVDAAQLMARVPGGAVNANGPLTGQVQYRGLFGPRMGVSIDGMSIHGGGPNWMAPPLHHIPAGLMQDLVVHRGIASLHTGAGLGGSVTATWKRPAYGAGLTGDLELTSGATGRDLSRSAMVGYSTDGKRAYLVGVTDEGDDMSTPDGDLAATAYERYAWGAGAGIINGGHALDVDVRRIANGDPTPLRFANTRAALWGADVAFDVALTDRLTMARIASVVSGQRKDVDDSLYRVAPASLRVSLSWSDAAFDVSVEQVITARQDDLSATNTLDPGNRRNSFTETDGWSLTNLYADWRAGSGITVRAGVENLLDARYVDHTSGFNRVMGSLAPIGTRPPGSGREFFLRARYAW